MRGQDHIGIDPQIPFLNTETEAFGDDLAGGCLDENGQPFRDSEGDVIQPHIGDDAIMFHRCRYYIPDRKGTTLRYPFGNKSTLLRSILAKET